MTAPGVASTLDVAYRWRRAGGLTPRMIAYGKWRGTEEGRLMAFMDQMTADHIARAAIGCPPRSEPKQAQAVDKK